MVVMRQYCSSVVLQWCRFLILKKRCQSLWHKNLLIYSSTAILSAILFSASPLQAKDLGTRGVLSPIEEENPIVLIQKKLQSLEESGELQRHQQRLQQKTKAAEGLTKTEKVRVFYYDPTFVVQEDIKDRLGQVIHKKGTKINPLETVSLSEDLLFIDGDDLGQKLWAFDRIQKAAASNQKSVISHQKNNKVRLILVKGEPLALSEEWGAPVYFDQGGVLVKKLGIRHIPALVRQASSEEGLERIKEVKNDTSSTQRPSRGDCPPKGSLLRIEEGGV